MEKNNNEKSSSGILVKHYFTSVFIYMIIVLFLVFSPIYLSLVNENSFDYTLVLGLLLFGYIFLAPILLFVFKPKGIESSRSILILNYITRQFKKKRSLEEFLSDIEPNELEKKSFMIIFMQSFFGIYCITALCNVYLPNLQYNFDFIKTFFQQAFVSISSGLPISVGLAQYLIDSGDVWIKIIGTITTVILLFSYLSDSNITRNKIKSIDTTPLGIFSCILCYYPMTILTNKFLFITENSLMPVKNQTLLAMLNLLVIIAHIGILFAVLRLGTKAGNLTNRGIETKFPYNIVRHPEYSMQILYIILTTIPLLILDNILIFEKILMLVATLGWIYLYYIRSITEERHLIKDENYQRYCEKVKFRFIPKLF